MNSTINRRLSKLEKAHGAPTEGMEWLSAAFAAYDAWSRAPPGTKEAAMAELRYLAVDPTRDFQHWVPVMNHRLEVSKLNHAKNEKLIELAGWNKGESL